MHHIREMMVMQNQQRPVMALQAVQSSADPALSLPITRYVVPRHHRVSALGEVIRRRAGEDMRAQAPLAGGTKEPVGMGQISERGLRVADFLDGLARIVHEPEWSAMGHGMIADPVTFIFCTFGRYSRRRIRKACPDHKKARPNSATSDRKSTRLNS